MSKKFKAVLYGEDAKDGKPETYTWAVVDDRFREGEGTTMHADNHTAYLTARGSVSRKWTPTVVLPFSERWEIEETQRIAKLIADTLNADWVRKELEGEQT